MNVNLDYINCAINNDLIAFEKVYRSIYKDLLKMAIYMLGNSDEAEDVVSETVLDAYTGISKLKDATKFEYWILRILSVKCKRKIRDKYQIINVHNPNVSNIEDIKVGTYILGLFSSGAMFYSTGKLFYLKFFIYSSFLTYIIYTITLPHFHQIVEIFDKKKRKRKKYGH